MLKKYIKETVKRELTKQKLNDIYGSSRTYNLNSVSDKERQQYNEEISTLKNYHNNMVERNKYLKLEISNLKRENEKLNYENKLLKQDSEEVKIRHNKISKENKKLNDENNLLKQKNKNNEYRIAGCKLIDDTIKEVTLINQTGLEFVVTLLKNNVNLEEYNYFHFYIDNIHICTLQKQFIKNGTIEQILYELNDVIGEETPNYLTLLEQEIDKLKESIENLEGKLILKGNLLSEQREENEKLKNILNEIHEICDSTWGEQLPYFKVRSLLNKIREISENALNGENDDIKNMKQENKKLKKENEILERSYNFISNNTLPELESGVTSKERIATELNLMLNKEKRKVEELEQEIKELKSKDYSTTDIHIVQLEEANSKIETIGNMVEKLINKNQELKQENKKLKIKLDEYYNKFISEAVKKEKAQQLIEKIEKQIGLQGINQDDFYSPEQTFYRIKNILKES